jgi:hypothetical protein
VAVAAFQRSGGGKHHTRAVDVAKGRSRKVKHKQKTIDMYNKNVCNGARDPQIEYNVYVVEEDQPQRRLLCVNDKERRYVRYEAQC